MSTVERKDKVMMIIMSTGTDNQGDYWDRPSEMTGDRFFRRASPGMSMRNTINTFGPIDESGKRTYRYVRFLVSPDSSRLEERVHERGYRYLTRETVEGAGRRFRIDGLRIADLPIVEMGVMGDRFGLSSDLGKTWIKLPRVFGDPDSIVLDVTNLGSVACHLFASLLTTMEMPAGDRAIGLDDFRARLRCPA